LRRSIAAEKWLVIGLGGGHTAAALVQTPGVERITIVELQAGLRPFLQSYLPIDEPVLSDARVNFVVYDGRRFLYANHEDRYDMIIIDPQSTSSAGSNNLYSADAVRLYQKHLASEGVLCAWTNEFSLMPVTFAYVFPFVDRVHSELVAKKRPSATTWHLYGSTR
jgi:spermidine synthase